MLPGALYVWSYERQTGLWGINLPDRLIRFLGVSALFHVVAAPATYWLWFSWIRDGELRAAGHLPWGLYAGLLSYAVVPIAVGSYLGGSDRSLARFVQGDQKPPRAWDYFFAREPDGWMRLKLHTGKWIGGAYGEGSFASGYPESQEILIAEAADIDPDTGEFRLNTDGSVSLRGSQLLVAWDDVQYLEFIDA